MAATLPSGAPKNKWAPPLRTIEEVTRLLKPRDGSSGTAAAAAAARRLDEIKLCWIEPEKESSSGVLNKKNIASLERALKKTPSRIQRLSIGWKHGGNRKPLIQLLQVFATHGVSLASLQEMESIELVLAAWIPDHVLQQLLQTYGPQLKRLHIQATRMKVRTKKSTPTVFKNVYQSVHAVEYLLQEESVVKILATPLLAQQMPELQTLSFVDCDILDDEVDILVKFLWQNYSRRGLPSLSLRSNRHMSPKALQKICQAPVSERLDLSLTDMTNHGAHAVSRALQPHQPDTSSNHGGGWRQRHNIILKELSLCGNYQLDEFGFRTLSRTCPNYVEKLDLSYCDLNENQTLVVLREMFPCLAATTCPLKEFVLQGAKINNAEACRTLQAILRTNRSLTKLFLDDPKYPCPTSIPNLQTIVQQGLSNNYVLKEFVIDLHSWKRQRQLAATSDDFEYACHVRDEMQFYLILNRAGRSLLQSDNHFLERQALIDALLKARLSGRLDVLYWLVRNGVVHLF